MLVLAAVPPTTRVRARHVDFLGAASVRLGLGGIVFALIEQPRLGWTSPAILVPLVGGVVDVRRLPRLRAPRSAAHAQAELFARRNFAVGNIETLAMYAGLAILFFFLVIFLQQVAGYSALRAASRRCR